MKKLFLIVFVIFSLQSSAQIYKVSLQASGLTCSMCSNSINKALKTLNFVDRIDANLKTYTFDLTFTSNANIDFDLIKKKVEDAGFAVAGFVATIHFDHAQIKDGQVRVDDKTFIFPATKDQLLNGVKQIRILDKGFVSARESKKSGLYISIPKTYHATI